MLSFGSWVTFGTQLAGDLAADCLAAAYDAGVNFFDNAEAYAAASPSGSWARPSPSSVGRGTATSCRPRSSGASTTRVNMRNTLNRKYLLQAIDGSLERFGLDFVDLLYCHRADPDTPIEETVWAMSDIVASGKALYWGTSEWSADEIRAAWDIADRHHLHKPVVEQPQYNLFDRDRVEKEYARLYEDIGLGLTTWSPLASGLLIGQVRRRDPRGQPGHAAGLRVVEEHADRRGEERKGPGAAIRGRGARLHAGPAGHRLVRQEPARLHGHHRGQPGRAGHRRTWSPWTSCPS